MSLAELEAAAASLERNRLAVHDAVLEGDPSRMPSPAHPYAQGWADFPAITALVRRTRTPEPEALKAALRADLAGDIVQR